MTTDAYPSVVALVIDGRLCTGVLVAPTVVFTAAHCVVAADDVAVYAGPSIREGEPRGATRWGAHPRYCADCRDERFDFGFVELSEALETGTSAPIATQSELDEAMRVDEMLQVVGFGAAAGTGAASCSVRAYERERPPLLMIFSLLLVLLTAVGPRRRDRDRENT